MKSKIIAQLSFAQKWEDYRYIGHCSAYAMLFYTYIATYKLKNKSENINYQSLVSVLNEFSLEQKRKYYENKYGFGFTLSTEIAPLNRNFCGISGSFDDVCEEIFGKIKNFIYPSFYFISFGDEKNIFGSALGHTVGLYVASSREIHFFDSNTGLRILRLSNDLNISDLKEDLLHLMFKQQFLFKWYFNTNSNTLLFSFHRSDFNVSHKTDFLEKCFESGYSKDIRKNKNLIVKTRNILLHFIRHPNINPDEINSYKLGDNIKQFLRINLFVIKKQSAMLKNIDNANSNVIDKSEESGFTRQGLVNFGVATIGIGFFAYKFFNNDLSQSEKDDPELGFKDLTATF